jgi:hypothetical protein
MNDVPVAKEISLRKTRRMAPPFHHHIATRKLMEGTWQKGDRVIIYEIVSTVPEGQVRVNKETIIQFDVE